MGKGGRVGEQDQRTLISDNINNESQFNSKHLKAASVWKKGANTEIFDGWDVYCIAEIKKNTN